MRTQSRLFPQTAETRAHHEPSASPVSVGVHVRARVGVHVYVSRILCSINSIVKSK